MNVSNLIFTSLSLASFSVGAAIAGDAPAPLPDPVVESKTWCEALRTIGTLYKNKENPYVQEFKIFGRYHYQAGSIAGNDANNDGFNDRFDMHRRTRLGIKMKFGKYFDTRIESQMVSDSRRKGGALRWGQPETPWLTYDQVWLRFNAQKAFGIESVDKLSFTYGRQKLLIGAEVHESSNNIKTIERSALANTVYLGSLPAGFTMSVSKGSWKVNTSIYSDVLADTRWDSILGDWSGGQGYLLNVIKTYDNKDRLIFDFLYHKDDNGPGKNDFFFNKKWATSLSYQGTRGPWGFILNAIGGEHPDDSAKPERTGLFYGVIGQGTYWLIQDKLEAVGQYQWQGSQESEGVRAYSKDFGSGTSSPIGEGGHGGFVNKGYGNSHHQVYAGVNWYLCGDKTKVMLGVEYDNLDTPFGTADAVTLWAGYRMSF